MRPYRGYLRLGEGEGIRNDDYGVEAYESWDEQEREAAPADELEPLRIEAANAGLGQRARRDHPPRRGRARRDAHLVHEGLLPRPGADRAPALPGHPNRRLRVLEVEAASPGDEILHGEKTVGRVTSAVPGRALGYVRREVPDDAVLLSIGGAEARLHFCPARP